MFLFHYILPYIILFIVLNNKEKISFKKLILYPFKPSLFKNEKGKIDNYKIMFWGLILANLIDLDHIYLRLIGKVGWFASACAKRFTECSFGVYPLHSLWFFIVLIILSPLVFSKNKLIKFIGWIGIGGIVHFFLDFIMLKTGIGF